MDQNTPQHACFHFPKILGPNPNTWTETDFRIFSSHSNGQKIRVFRSAEVQNVSKKIPKNNGSTHHNVARLMSYGTSTEYEHIDFYRIYTTDFFLKFQIKGCRTNQQVFQHSDSIAKWSAKSEVLKTKSRFYIDFYFIC